MQYNLTVVGKLGQRDIEQAIQVLQANGFVVARQLVVGQAIELQSPSKPAALEPLFGDLQVDWCLHNGPIQIASVLICDMDSTIIGQECIDELADLAGIGDMVKAITEAAMKGDLEFSHSLAERVKQFAAINEQILQQCWNNRITINSGAKTLVATMNRLGATTALVSGGFTWFAKRVADAVGFDEFHANQLQIKDHKLTGEVVGPMIDGLAKLAHLKRLVAGSKISCVIGDGANDIAMVQGADIGIAYYAKPVLEQSANGRIRHTDLTTALLFQGISPEQWAG